MNLTTIEVPFNGKSFFIDIAEGNMVSLNYIYEISGKPDGKRDPRRWKEEAGKDFIDFIADNLNVRISDIYKTKRGKHNGGTWAHWQIGMAYAKYLSPELHLAVNQIFKERLEESLNPELGIERSKERAIKSWEKQGHDKEWIAEREKHIDTRKFYVNTLLDHEVKNGYEIGFCTNKIYKGIFKKDKNELERDIRCKNPNLPKQINIRDHAKRSSIAAIGLAEALAAEEIEEHDITGVKDCSQVSFDKGKSVRMAIEDSMSKAPRRERPRIIDEGKNEVNKKGIQNLKDALKGKK